MEISTIIALVGAVVPTITVAVLLYDRFFLKRPVLDVVAEAPDIFLGIPATVFLKIRNWAGTDILVTAVETKNPRVIVAFDEKPETVLELDAGLPWRAPVVPAGEERLLRIDWNHSDLHQSVRLKVSWRRITGRLNGFPIWHRLDLHEYESIVETNVIGQLRNVASVREASEMLLWSWPTEDRGPAYSSALAACYAALRGSFSPEVARVAFVRAAKEAGIFVRE